MDISANVHFFVYVLFATVRVGAVLVLSPLFSIAQVPAKIKSIWILGLSCMLAAGLGSNHTYIPSTIGELLSAVLYEALIGGVFGFGIFTAFAVFLFGGRLLDYQMGFGVAGLIDPVTKAHNPLLGTVLSLLAVTLFFAVNGHHMIIRGLAYSFEHLPIGSDFFKINIQHQIMQFGIMFVYGLSLVAPAVITLLMIDIGMAVAARTMPQVNMFIVGFPVKIFVGLMVLALSINYLTPLFERVFGSIFRYWEAVIEA